MSLFPFFIIILSAGIPLFAVFAPTFIEDAATKKYSLTRWGWLTILLTIVLVIMQYFQSEVTKYEEIAVAVTKQFQVDEIHSGINFLQDQNTKILDHLTAQPSP